MKELDYQPKEFGLGLKVTVTEDHPTTEPQCVVTVM